MPQLAFGLYKVPPTEEGESIVLNAIAAGYRHFDTASYYENEKVLGQALKKSGIPRNEFFICSKVWNDAQRKGREAVRGSVEKSLAAFDFGDDGGCYIDLLLVHWPVPGYHVETYKELELMCKEGTIRSIGLSNYKEKDFNELVESNITIQPVVNQFEISPFMYRPSLAEYFQRKGVSVSASKGIGRGECFDKAPIQKLSTKYSKSPAQIMLRWGLQKNFCVVAKTATPSRMRENRSILDYYLEDEDMIILDSLTSKEDVKKRDERELQSKIT
uniref:NADP-dependent oxidoreductase domain-containing protein n=2 Tax=Ditylum brightwellii TaxID=49249 RepID=A0A7S4WCK1_9STRA